MGLPRIEHTSAGRGASIDRGGDGSGVVEASNHIHGGGVALDNSSRLAANRREPPPSSSRNILIRLDSSATYHKPIPPLRSEDSLLEMYTSSIQSVSPRHANTTSNKTLAMGGTPQEYAQRLHARPTTTPAVIGFDSKLILPQEKPQGQVRAVNGFFPPVKLRGSANSTKSKRSTKSPQESPQPLELAPNLDTFTSLEQRYNMRPAYPNKGTAETSPTSAAQTTTTEADRTQQSILPPEVAAAYNTDPRTGAKLPNYLAHISGNETQKYSNLPMPNQFVNRKDNPWVYRYKVKKTMQEMLKLKILAQDPKRGLVNAETGGTW